MPKQFFRSGFFSGFRRTVSTDMTGPISLPIKYLRDTLAACPTFQAAVGAANATEAKTFIRIGAKKEDVPRPFALINVAKFDSRYSNTDAWNAGKALHLLIEFPLDTDLDEESQRIDFYNQAGAICQELKNRSRTGEYLESERIESRGVGVLDPDENQGQHVGAADFIVHHRGYM